MTKINNYIRYLLTLILLGSINVYAQTTGDLNQLISGSEQELSNLLPSSTSSINTASFAEIIKQNMDKFVYYLINYALPFLAVYGILTYLAQESGKEINRPLHLIFFIMAFLATIFFRNTLNIFTLVFTLILVIVGFHKIFHGITGSIIGFLVAIAILIGVLTNDSLKGFLSSTAYFIFLFVLFIIIFILSIKIGKGLPQSEGFKELMKSMKKLSYFINRPEDIRKLEEQINKTIEDFRTVAKTLIENIENIEKALFNPQNQQNNQNIMEKIKEVMGSYRALQQYYKDILTYINNIENNINIYDEAIRPQISNFLNMKKKELLNIKNSVDTMYNRTIISPQAKQIINRILVNPISQKITVILRRIGTQSRNLKSILSTLENPEEIYKDLINQISSINPTIDPNNLNTSINNLINSIDNLIKNAQDILTTLDKKKQEFDSEYIEILKNLEHLKHSIDKFPNQEVRSSLYKTVGNFETTTRNYHQAFNSYYTRHYEIVNQLINRLQLIKDDMGKLENQIKKLNGYYNKFRQENDPMKKNTIAGRFIDFYNKNTKNLIDRIIQHISNIPTPMITRHLYIAIENLKNKLRTAIRQLNDDIEQKYEEMKDFHADWSRQRRNQRRQNRQQDNRRGNRNGGRRGR
jgi:hypothetical protein